MKKIKLAVLEDNKDVANMLKDIINKTNDLICNSVYHNAEEAMLFIPRNPVDVLIVDLGLPGISGLDAIKALSDQCPDTLFCVFTVYDDDEKIFSALEVGAKGYILKTADKNNLMDNIRELYSGGSPMSPYIARRVIERFSNIPQKLHENHELPITERENDLLKLLANGLSYKEISEEVGISVGTVKQHFHNIYSKLHVSNRIQAINLYNQNNTGKKIY
jgi:two-component system, NarL family, response regulator LiaR